MESFVEKFDAFDLFTHLIPGMILSTLYASSLYLVFSNSWNGLGAEKYFVFLVGSYFVGVVFKELSYLLDKLFLWKWMYGGRPREIFLTEKGKQKIFDDEMEYTRAVEDAKFIVEELKLEMSPNDIQIDFLDTKENRIRINSIFAYCLNVLESSGMSPKSNKMAQISEMTTSLFWGCIAAITLNIILLCCFDVCQTFYMIESGLLIVAAVLLLCRKRRFEKYRIQITMRYFTIWRSNLVKT